MDHIAFGNSSESVIIIDQTLLPGEEKYIELKTPEEMYEAIQKLRVRGAPAIGIFAGYALAALAMQEVHSHANLKDPNLQDKFKERMETLADYLKSSRPTAVNLAWAADRLMTRMKSGSQKKSASQEAWVKTAAEDMKQEAIRIRQEDITMCKTIAELGVQEIKKLAETRSQQETFGILTHCNAGPLATSEYGTALGPILLGTEQGIELQNGKKVKLKAFADETRPLLQGARLTSYELERGGVDVTLICDNMASIVMKNGWVQACFVGCDRVAANGDTANKIGTSGVAILAAYYGIPFYVLGPTSSIDIHCPTGEQIPIEERDPEEIKTKFYENPMAPDTVKCYNPAFDVTNHTLIAGIITEKGILRPPYELSIKKAIRED